MEIGTKFARVGTPKIRNNTSKNRNKASKNRNKTSTGRNITYKIGISGGGGYVPPLIGPKGLGGCPVAPNESAPLYSI